MTNDLRIADAPLLVDVSGEEKLPTGGYGNYSATINQIADFTQLKWKLATEGYVNNEINVVTNKLNTHTQDKTNPHGVTKEQVGLGEVDNTADLDKPVSAYQRTAIDEKIAKTSLADNLTTNDSTKVLSAKQGKLLQDTKANKSEVYTKDETLTLKREDQYVITESGRTQREKNKDVIFVEDYGAIGDGKYHPLSEKYATLALAKLVYTNIADRIYSLDQSIDYVAFQSALETGNNVNARIAKYVLTDGLEFKGNRIIGANTCNWQQMDASAIFRNIDNATVLLMYGTGKKDKTSYYNNAELTTGGVLTNPNPYSLGDAKYSLYDFTNADATDTQPATPKPFSVALYCPPNSEGSGIENIVVLPYFNGINGYLDQNTFELGDEWDIGLFQDACSNITMERSAIIGYWRITAHLWSASSSYDRLRKAYGVDNEAISGRAFDTHITNCRFQGLVGQMIRGGCFYRCTDTTASTVTIPWDNSHPFPNAGSRDKIFGSPKGSFTYESWSKVGDNLVFAGVSPNPVTLDLKTNPIRYGFHYGFGGSSVSSSIITGLEHSSRRWASDVETINLGISKCLEVHTYSGRNIIYDNVYLQTFGEVMLHMHNFTDLHFKNCSQFEAGNFKNKAGVYQTGGARCIGTEAPAKNPLTTGAGFSGVFFDESNNITGVVDARPYINKGSASRYASDSGLFTPRYLMDGQSEYPKDQTNSYLVRQSLPSKGIRDYSATDWGVGVGGSTSLSFQISSTGNISFTGQVTCSSGNLFLNAKADSSVYLRSGTTLCTEVSSTGQVLPNIALESAIGSPSRIWGKTYASRYLFNANVGAYCGSGDPNGVIIAGVGSTYHRTDGGAGTCFYVKESGTGSSGWVAK